MLRARISKQPGEHRLLPVNGRVCLGSWESDRPPPANVEVLQLNPPLQCLSLMLALSLATPLRGKSYRSLLPHPSVDISLPPAGLKEGTLGAV